MKLWSKRKRLQRKQTPDVKNVYEIIIVKWKLLRNANLCRTFCNIYPLTTTRYKNAVQLYEFLAISVLYRYICKFYTVEPCFSAACCKKQNQFIIYTTHFRSVFVLKRRFFAQKAVHCSGALLKKRKRFFISRKRLYCSYNKNFNRFEF